MLDIALIREKPDWVKDQIRKLNDQTALERIDAIVALDVQRREVLQEAENLKGYRNRLSKQTGRMKGDKKTPLPERYALAQAIIAAAEVNDWAQADALFENPPAVTRPDITEGEFNEAMNALFAAMKALGDNITELDELVRSVEETLDTNMLWVPNLPHASVPVAESEDANIAHPEKGKRHTHDFAVKPHWDLAPELGLIDFERGVKLAGTRFYVLTGMGARLQRALTNFLLDELLTHEGFDELYVPHMLREPAMYGSGQFPKFMDTVYKIEGEDIYLIPTSEVAIVNMFGNDTFEEAELPLNLTSRTPCFRQEKMSGGRDVRGIKRVHQFEKVEMIKITTPENSYNDLEVMTETAERLLEKLELPYRRLEIVTGDLGFTAAKKYDVEVWAPGCEEWLEVSSCSNCEDFQARRANIKYRPTDGGKQQFVHTLNGSAFGMTRMLIALMENYQTAEGGVCIPTALQPYMGGIDYIKPGA